MGLASLGATPLMVTLMCVWSDPGCGHHQRHQRLIATRDGANPNKNSMSMEASRLANSTASTVCVKRARSGA